MVLSVDIKTTGHWNEKSYFPLTSRHPHWNSLKHSCKIIWERIWFLKKKKKKNVCAIIVWNWSTQGGTEAKSKYEFFKKLRLFWGGKAHLLNLFFQWVARGCWKQRGWQGTCSLGHMLLAFASNREQRQGSILDLSSEVLLFLYQTWPRESLTGLPLSSWWSDWLTEDQSFWKSYGVLKVMS